jgi:hypothetical protein
MKTSVVFTIASTLIASTCAASAQTNARPVGMVEKIETWTGGEARALLARKSEPERSLILGEYVYEGDRIRVPQADATVTISMKGGPLSICPRGARQEQCAATLQPQGVLASVVAFARSLDTLVAWYGDEKATSTVNLTSRGAAPPKFEIGGRASQKIKAGKRALWVAWSGGDAPWMVRVVQAGKAMGEMVAKNGREIVLPGLDIAPGTLEIEVSDEKGRKAVLKAEAVGALPAAPDFSGSAPDKLHEDYLSAAWLATQADGAYVLEAVARLTPLTANLPAARALRMALGAGERLR